MRPRGVASVAAVGTVAGTLAAAALGWSLAHAGDRAPVVTGTAVDAPVRAAAKVAEGPSAGGAPAAGRPAPPAAQEGNPPYDGRFAFVRLRFGRGGRSMSSFGRRGRGGGAVWAHDHPRAETNFLKILNETTYVGTNLDGRVILTLDDPELFRYPVAYIVEVGYWSPTDEEVAALRSWLLKGGFLIVDDFRAGDLRNFEAQMRRVLPEAELLEVDPGHRIFDSFFHIEDPAALHPPTFTQFAPIYLGLFEDNDPNGRIMVMVNYNQDIAEYWEYSDYGYHPIALANDAYKFGVNYVIYGYTY